MFERRRMGRQRAEAEQNRVPHNRGLSETEGISRSIAPRRRIKFPTMDRADSRGSPEAQPQEEPEAPGLNRVQQSTSDPMKDS